jgi:flagellin
MQLVWRGIRGLGITGVEFSGSDAEITVKAANAGEAGNSIGMDASAYDAFSLTEATTLIGGKDEVPSGYSATTNGEAVTQAIVSGDGEKTYSTASGLSIIADLGTFSFTGGTMNISFNVTISAPTESEKCLQVGQLRVADVTKDSIGGVMTQAEADSAITVINSAIEVVSAERSRLGAMQNRLEHTISNPGTSAENL